jgi:hypothetical protein
MEFNPCLFASGINGKQKKSHSPQIYAQRTSKRIKQTQRNVTEKQKRRGKAQGGAASHTTHEEKKKEENNLKCTGKYSRTSRLHNSCCILVSYIEFPLHTAQTCDTCRALCATCRPWRDCVCARLPVRVRTLRVRSATSRPETGWEDWDRTLGKLQCFLCVDVWRVCFQKHERCEWSEWMAVHLKRKGNQKGRY